MKSRSKEVAALDQELAELRSQLLDTEGWMHTEQQLYYQARQMSLTGSAMHSTAVQMLDLTDDPMETEDLFDQRLRGLMLMVAPAVVLNWLYQRDAETDGTDTSGAAAGPAE